MKKKFKAIFNYNSKITIGKVLILDWERDIVTVNVEGVKISLKWTNDIHIIESLYTCDKNNKEIYEGDRLLADNGDEYIIIKAKEDSSLYRRMEVIGNTFL